MKRRDFLKTGTGAVLACTCVSGLGACSMLTGVSGTAEAPAGSYALENGIITLDLRKAGPVINVEGSVKFSIDRNDEEIKVIVVLLSDGSYRAYEDRCTHGGRELEYKAGEQLLNCVSFGNSKFNLDGSVISGPAEKAIRIYKSEKKGDSLRIFIN